MSEDNGYTPIVEVLAGLEPDATIVWDDDHLKAAPDLHTGWIDVRLGNPVGDMIGYNWVWTIDAELDVVDGEPVDPTTIVVPYNRQIWRIWDTDELWFVEDGPMVVLDSGAELDDRDSKMLDDYAAQSPSYHVNTQGAWTTDAVNAAISAWILEHVGRDDITVVRGELAPSELVQQAAATLEAIESGSEETIELGDGVVASQQAFDFLLSLGPDEAAHVETELRNKLGLDK